MMEEPSDIIGLEEELQGVAMAMMERIFRSLVDRGLTKNVDVGAFLTFLVCAIPMWFVTVRVQPKWVGAPRPGDAGWRERCEGFMRSLFEAHLFG